ncbi:phospholipase D [Malassezia vespertilionis]|uniref:Phospholipase n=1 Tax=Malassezia vespertilionis TaxID=2020962 RepID=A0A2N1JF85_9BASI|nr:phospholipase D [Malassezia vespertilionis]PKI85217.1 Spo14p [Malassezia vespertilionis]WFD05943.1 phospholipase D [Malassezia vespertilionis]
MADTAAPPPQMLPVVIPVDTIDDIGRNALPNRDAPPSTTAAPTATTQDPISSQLPAAPGRQQEENQGVSNEPGNKPRPRFQNFMRLRGQRSEQNRQRAPVSVVDQLQFGMLPVAMVKMQLERDEHNDPPIPILGQELSAKITHTVHTGNTGHTLYRIELDYAFGMIRWAIYREVRDFLALHTYLRTQSVRGYLNKTTTRGNTDGEEGLPRFPRALLVGLLSIQHMPKWLSQRPEDEKEDALSDREAREALELYLNRLVRRVAFTAQVNRVCLFLEFSVMSLQMACIQGELGKQGYLKIKSRSSPHSIMKFGTRERIPRWFIVRESCIVVMEQAASLNIHDVFLMDQEFELVQGRHLQPHVVEYSNDEIRFVEKSGDKNKSRVRTGATAHHYFKRHNFYVKNAERKMKLGAKSEREMEQFLMSIKWVAARNQYGQPNRFGSFAPIRCKANAQWLVDGRDYFWALSEAISNARERIYIHDWWLSPELYLRRPGTLEWRLDHLLKRKAEEGVHIYIVLYNEVANQFTPTDSGYSKQHLMALHSNIFVQRSPNHFQMGTFYWAHHEKVCIVDEMVAFMGGFDLCFGRWDTPSHALVDDPYMEHPEGLSLTPGFLGPTLDGKHEAQVWPGQDYANERVAEWHTLNKPEQDVINRERAPRMPWHDTGVQIMGQPARDLCRHFVQRWNMLLRSKNHTRKMSFLMPPPELGPEELKEYGVQGTCEIQICRSAGPWSLHTPKTVEHSVQNAYLKCIQMSDHFVYIENQFFVTSTALDNVQIENSIGLALVERIVRAHRQGTPWRAIIVIPLTPGFPMSYDNPESSSLRIIQSLQYLSISRGPNSIFGRLLRAGVNPDEYIGFFSLRTWGMLRNGRLSTEQLYIHGKTMVVDDRIALIGSANINERSQRGDRDSELLAVIRDEDMIDSTMAGQPYKVGRFAHTLRLRQMREHAGIDTDMLENAALKHEAYKPKRTPAKPSANANTSLPSMPGRRRTHSRSNNLFAPLFSVPEVDPDAFIDPLDPEFYEDVWLNIADYNTYAFRCVFHCVPDDDIKTWVAYTEAMHWSSRLNRSLWQRPASQSNAPLQWAGETLQPEPDVFSAQEHDQMVALLQTCCGNLVHHPLLFMEQEAAASNFMFPMDHITPTMVFD